MVKTKMYLNNVFNTEPEDFGTNYIDIMGIRLYFDDLLLIGIIFFLYNEKIEDNYLFISLILLLLS